MILVIGNKNCPNCLMTKKLFDKKGITYDYKLLSELSEDNKEYFTTIAKNAGNMTMPIIIRDGVSVTKEQVLNA